MNSQCQIRPGILLTSILAPVTKLSGPRSDNFQPKFQNPKTLNPKPKTLSPNPPASGEQRP